MTETSSRCASLLLACSIGLAACSVNGGAPCVAAFIVEFGEISVAGEYEFRVSTAGADVKICKMQALAGRFRPTCDGFSFEGTASLVWDLGALSTLPVVSVSIFRDGVYLGKRDFITAAFRAAKPDAECADFMRFSFVTGEPVVR